MGQGKGKDKGSAMMQEHQQHRQPKLTCGQRRRAGAWGWLVGDDDDDKGATCGGDGGGANMKQPQQPMPAPPTQPLVHAP